MPYFENSALAGIANPMYAAAQQAPIADVRKAGITPALYQITPVRLLAIRLQIL